MSTGAIHQQYQWWAIPEDQAPDDMTRGSFQESFHSSSPPFGDYQPNPGAFFPQDIVSDCLPAPNQIDLDINDPLIAKQHAEPWSAFQVVNDHPPGYPDSYAQQQQQYSAPMPLQSQASGSAYGHTSPSTYMTGHEEQSIYSGDASSEKQYRPTISPKSVSRPKGGRSRASSTYSGRTSTSVTKRKAEEEDEDDDEDAPFACVQCSARCRTESELKKHGLKHYKPNMCDVPDCQWLRGFTTPNDVWRHKASIHKIYQPGSKIYLCAAAECLNKSAKEEKHWPRLDNFRQHIERMHPNEDVEKLVARSTVCVDTLGQNNLPQHMQRTHMLQAVQGGIIVTQSKGNSIKFSQPPNFEPPPPPPPPVPMAQSAVAQQSTWTSGGDQHLRPPEDRRRSSGSTPKRRQVQSVSSTSSRATQPLPPIVLHQSVDENQPQKVTHPDETPLQQLTRALAAASTNKSITPERAIMDVLEKFQLGNGPIYTAPRVQEITLADAEGDAVDDAAMEDAPIKADGESPPDGVVAGHVASDGNTDDVPNETVKAETKSGIQCDMCPKILQRDCDMRKHRMRHVKPFGCTFTKCNGQFGSKNDWKRHEQSQHFQNVAWTCRLTAPGRQQPCAHLYYEEAKFRTHLSRTHKDVQDIEKQVQSGRIGHNGISSFWCGFCREIVQSGDGNSKSWDERFNHVGEHFVNSDKDPKLHIRHWLPPRGHQTKGELGDAAPECNEDVHSEDETTGGSSDPVYTITVDPRFMTSKSRHSRGRGKKHYCCVCNEPMDDSCLACGHHVCESCTH